MPRSNARDRHQTKSRLENNALTTLPEGIFEGLTSLEEL